MASQDWLEKDFYKTLGVSQDVSEKDLKSTYRKLARTYHPDSNPGDTAAEERFKEISEAYSVLSDPKQRAEYDQIRALGAGGARFTGSGGGQYGGTGGFEDIFSNLFTGGGGAGRSQRRSSRTGANYEDIFNLFSGPGQGEHIYPDFGGYPQDVRGDNVRATVTTSFKDAIQGTTMRVQAPSGEKVSFRIPPGVKNGQTIRVAKKGSPSPTGGEPGDLLIRVKVDKHPIFTRDGNNLRITVPITFFEAVSGATIEVPTLDGDIVKMKVPAGTSSGKVLRIRNRGVKTAKAHGDLLVTLEIAVPQKLSTKAGELLNTLAEEIGDENPRDDFITQAHQ